MKKMFSLMGAALLSISSLFAQDCENYSFYLVDNHVGPNDSRSSEIYQVTLDDGAQTATLTEIYSLNKTVHLGFNEEDQLLYTVCSTTGTISAIDVTTLGPETPIGSLSSGFGFVEMVYDGNGTLIVANEVTDEIVAFDVNTATESVINSAAVHGGDLVITDDGDTHMYTRNNGGQIVDLSNGNAVIGTIANWTTGAALMDNGQILVSVRYETQFEVYNDDGTHAGSYDILKDGLPFELDNGDLAGGCNDAPNVEEPCQNFKAFYASHVNSSSGSTIYHMNIGGGIADLSELTTRDYELHISYDQVNNIIYAVNANGSFIERIDPVTGGSLGTISLDAGLNSLYCNVYANGVVYLASANQDRVVEVDLSDGSWTVIATNVPVQGGDLVVRNGNLYLATRDGDKIYEITGGMAVEVGDIPAEVNGIAISASSDYLLANFGSDSFYLIDEDGDVVEAYPAMVDGNPFGLLNGDLASGCYSGSPEVLIECVGSPVQAYNGGEEVINISDQACNGFEFALWTNNLALDISPSMHWTIENGSFVENADGSAVFTGTFTNNANSNLIFEMTTILSGRTFDPPAGSPKEEACVGDVPNDDWYYYTETVGVLIGAGDLEGAVVEYTRMGEAFQVGTGANGKDPNQYGASGWLNFDVVSQPNSGPGFNVNSDHGDFNFGLAGQPQLFDTPIECITICEGESTSLSAQGLLGLPPYSFEWSTGDMEQSITVSPTESTAYSVTVTDANGVQSTTSIFVTVNSLPTVELVEVDGSCESGSDGSMAAIPSGNGPFTFLWSNDDTSSSIENLEVGTYAVTVTDVNGCTVQGEGEISFSDEEDPEVICAIEDGVISITSTDNCQVASVDAYIELPCGDQIPVEDGQYVEVNCPEEVAVEAEYSEDGNYLYAFRGRGKDHFWRYNVTTDDWEDMADAPDKVEEGGALTYAGGDYIYALQGDKEKGFWRYSLLNNSWTVMANTPDKVRYGGALVYGGGDYIYAFRGDDREDFWRYSISGDSWESMADAPNDVKDGGALVYTGGDHIFALRGDDRKDFWRYSISDDSWSEMDDTPYDVRNGGALTHDGDNYIYAFRGDNRTHFWRYDIAADDWSWKANAPNCVKDGGSLVYGDDGLIYAFRGADKDDFWKYNPATDDWSSSLDDAPDKVKYGGSLTKVGAYSIETEPVCEWEIGEDGGLYITSETGELVVVAEDASGNQAECSTDIECEEPEIPCGECEGQITSLDLEYIGDEYNATVRIYSGHLSSNNLIAIFYGVNPGDVMSFEGQNNHNKMGSKIFLTVNSYGYCWGVDEVEIHTSCSEEIYVGMEYDDQYRIVAGMSHGGGPLCEMPEPSDDDCISFTTNNYEHYVSGRAIYWCGYYFAAGSFSYIGCWYNVSTLSSYDGNCWYEGECGSAASAVVIEGSGVAEMDGALAQADELNSELDYFPNPSNGDLTINFKPVKTENASIEIYNTSGKLVKAVFNGVVQEGVVHTDRIDLRHLENGVYIIRVTGADYVEMKKFILAL